MSNSTVIGHEKILHRFARWLERDRVSGTYLFVGPPGIGKRRVALWIAQCLLCDESPSTSLDCCGRCPACQQVATDQHPDLHFVEREPDRQDIRVELLTGDPDKNTPEGLVYDISLKPFCGGRKVAIINDADRLNLSGSNKLLKTLEEPPPHTVIILISKSEYDQLPTIRSRAQIIRFAPLTRGQVKQILINENLIADAKNIDELVATSGGSVAVALQLAEPEMMDFRLKWLAQLASLDPCQDNFAATMTSFVEKAGKETFEKRDRLRLLSELAINFYRQVMVYAETDAIPADESIGSLIPSATGGGGGMTPEMIALCIDRCLEAKAQISANAHLPTLIECWLTDLGRIGRGDLVGLPV